MRTSRKSGSIGILALLAAALAIVATLHAPIGRAAAATDARVPVLDDAQSDCVSALLQQVNGASGAPSISTADAADDCQKILAPPPPASPATSQTVITCVAGGINAGLDDNSAIGRCKTQGQNGDTSCQPHSAIDPLAQLLDYAGGFPPTLGGATCSAPSSGGSSCSQWAIAGAWQFMQSNGYNDTWSLQQSGSQISGTLTLSSADQARGNYVSSTGSLQGTLSGSQLTLTTSQMAKNDGSASQGQYTGTVTAGQIVNGTAQDLLHPDSSATFTATGPASCAG